MDTNRLRQFCVIAETGSMTKAAELLFITHSGLSKAMKLLQEELSCQLLRPAGRGLALTEEGKRIYQNAKQFLQYENQLFSTKPSVNQHTLRIGTVEVFLKALCLELTQAPLTNYQWSLLDLNPGQIEQLVMSKQLDYGITYAPYPMAGIEITNIGRYQLGCYALRGHFTDMSINDIPFAVPAQGIADHPLGIKERDGWLESITPRNRQYSVNLLSTGLELTQLGLCAIYIPKFIACHYPDLIEITIPKAQKRMQHCYLVKHKDQPQDALFKRLKNAVKSITRY